MDLIMKLAALGDSIIKGVLFTQEENGHGHYSLSDHNIADRVADSLHCEVVNLGKMGCTIEAGERILERHMNSLDGTKYVLMCYGGNDSDYDWKAIANYPDGDGIEMKYDNTTLMTEDLVRILGRRYVAVNAVADKSFVNIAKPASV